MDQIIAMMQQKIDDLFSKLEQRFDEKFDEKFSELEQRLYEKFDRMEQKMNRMQPNIAEHHSEICKTVDVQIEQMQSRMFACDDKVADDKNILDQVAKHLSKMRQRISELDSLSGVTKKDIEHCEDVIEASSAEMRAQMEQVQENVDETMKRVDEVDGILNACGSRSVMHGDIMQQLIDSVKREEITFNGKNDDLHVLEYFRLLELKFKHVKLESYQKLAVATAGLSKDAIIWYREEEVEDYEDFKEKMVNAFWARKEQWKLSDEIAHGRYEGGVLMSVYFKKYVRLAKYLAVPMSDEYLAKQLSRHLPWRMKELLINNNKSTLAVLDFLRECEAEGLSCAQYRGNTKQSRFPGGGSEDFANRNQDRHDFQVESVCGRRGNRGRESGRGGAPY